MSKAQKSIEIIRLRVTPNFKKRVGRVARKKECGISDIARSAILSFVELEEAKAK